MIKAIGRFYKRVALGFIESRQRDLIIKTRKDRYIAALEKRIDALNADNIKLKAAWDSAYKRAEKLKRTK